MPTRKRITTDEATPKTTRPRTKAKPRRVRAKAKQTVSSAAVAAPQQKPANQVAGQIAPKPIKDNPRALSLPERGREKPLPRTGAATSAFMIVATKVVGLGRDLLGKVWGER